MIKKIIGYVAAMMMTAAACTGFTVAGQGYEMYQAAVAETSLESMVDSIRSKEGYTTLEELPDTYLNAVVSVEDHRFYSHFGLDPIAICRALVNDLRAGRYVEGGSTITQQLAKNLYFSHEKKMERKIAEVFAALELERKYSKDEILELYVKPWQMNEYECTLLAGVPNAPSRYAPTRNPGLAARRQQQVLRRMEACGHPISSSTKSRAAAYASQTAPVQTEQRTGGVRTVPVLGFAGAI